MSQRIVYDCDGCGQSLDNPNKLVLITGRGMDAAGSMDDKQVCLELCAECTAKAFAKIMPRVSIKHEDARWLVGQIKSRFRASEKFPGYPDDPESDTPSLPAR